MSLLEIRHLTKIFAGGTVALDDVNLAVDRGELLVLAGTNGSGKTVLARHLNGLLLPTSGEVLLEEAPIAGRLPEVRRQVGLVFQNSDNQIVGETVAADVAFGPENLGLPPAEVRERVAEALAQVDLAALAGARPQLLSGGQKRKLAIAGVLAMRPQLIVLDEPFTGLDYPGVVQILRQLLRLREQGHTLIIVTHELEKILAHADRMAVLSAGRLVASGAPGALLGLLEEYGIKRPYGEERPVATMTWLS
jgi:biotin transport system ATP-binding protein